MTFPLLTVNPAQSGTPLPCNISVYFRLKQGFKILTLAQPSLTHLSCDHLLRDYAQPGPHGNRNWLAAETADQHDMLHDQRPIKRLKSGVPLSRDHGFVMSPRVCDLTKTFLLLDADVQPFMGIG